MVSMQKFYDLHLVLFAIESLYNTFKSAIYAWVNLEKPQKKFFS